MEAKLSYTQRIKAQSEIILQKFPTSKTKGGYFWPTQYNQGIE